MKLKHLTDDSLLSDTLALVHEERKLMSQVLWYLKEIDVRKLYAEEQCSSLFDYCVKILKYSEAQASRRVTASRLLQELPELSEKIQQGLLNLTQLCQAQAFFKNKNIHLTSTKKQILAQLENKTARESEDFLFQDRPRKLPMDFAKQVSSESVQLTITLPKNTIEKLKKLQNLKSHQSMDLAKLMDRMCDETLKVWDPMNKKERKGAEIKKHTRYIPELIKTQVWKRDKGQCQKCGAQKYLEYDHIHPFSTGGQHTLENLRLLCSNCNQRNSVKFFGKDYEGRRQSMGSRP